MSNKNTPKTLGKGIVTENGNYMICKDNFYFFMTPEGKHLDGYEKEYQKLHCPQKWAELKAKSLVIELDENLATKATCIIESNLIPFKASLVKKMSTQ